MIAINNKGQCCGCGACAQACPVRCISIEADREGFLYPTVDVKRCLDCGRCERVCPVICADRGIGNGDDRVYAEPPAMGARHRDAAVREASSSGGVFTSFAHEILTRGGAVFGVALKGLRAQHVCARTEAEVAPMRGSKYVQSDTADAYSQVKACLAEGIPVLFTGTPCQTAGLAAFLGERPDNLYLVDFICHGVPSPKVFEKYLESVEQKNNSKIVSFSFREKDRGWQASGLQLGTRISLANGCEIRNYPALRDTYMNGFLEDIYLRPSCYECRFKTIPKWSADITIADFWGINQVMPDMNDGKGTSLVLIHNEHGMALFDAVRENLECRECDWKKAIRKNPTLLNSARRSIARETFFDELEANGYDWVARKHLGTTRTVVNKASRIIGKTVDGLLGRSTALAAKVLHVKDAEGFQEKAAQFIRFCMVGVTNVAVSYSVNIGTLFLLGRLVPGLQYDYIIANTVAFLTAVYWSFYWNSRKVFRFDVRNRKLRRRALFRTYLCYGFTGILLNNLLSTIWIRGLGISKYISPLINLVFTIPLNYLMNKKWAFAVKPENED